MTDHRDGDLFAGTAWHYARYRPGYPEKMFADLIDWFHLDGTRRLLDLGCGTGQMVSGLAAHVSEAVGVDPEPGMLAEADRQARAVQITNVPWRQGSSDSLPGGLGCFDLVTMGRSFHWMDRERTLETLDAMVGTGGGLVIANDSCLVRPATPWQHTILDVQQRFLPPDWQDRLPTVAGSHEPHQEVLARSAFGNVQQQTYQFTRIWTIEQAIGYLYSTSLPLRRLLGDGRAAFEYEVREALLAVDSSGRYAEPVDLQVLIARRR